MTTELLVLRASGVRVVSLLRSILFFSMKAWQGSQGVSIHVTKGEWSIVLRCYLLCREGCLLAEARVAGFRFRLFKNAVPSHEQLSHIVQMVEQHRLRVFVKGVLPLSAARKAYSTTGGAPTALGKLVLIADKSLA